MNVKEAISRLAALYPDFQPWWEGEDPFLVLVGIVISQNTSSANTRRALSRLRERGLTSPSAILSAPQEEIEDALRPAGLYRAKARILKDIARWAMDGGLERVLSLPHARAREEMMKVRGIGRKTADVFLAFVASAPIIGVDTHIMRIGRRWGLGTDYESVKEALEREIPPERRLWAHKALISFGREYCRARRPRCDACPLRDICPKHGIQPEL
jgi:endonuclease III